MQQMLKINGYGSCNERPSLTLSFEKLNDSQVPTNSVLFDKIDGANLIIFIDNSQRNLSSNFIDSL